MCRVFDWSNLPLGASKMIQHALKMIMAFAFVAVTWQSASAQTRGAPIFGVGYTDIGPVIGLGNLGEASVSFGGRFERGIKALPTLGNGMLGIQVGAQYYSWSSGGYSIRWIPIGVTANYHFKLDEPKIDPFAGLGLGYTSVSCSFSGTGSCSAYDSEIYLIARAGVRYFFSPSMALYGDVGAGGATLNVGLMFKLK